MTFDTIIKSARVVTPGGVGFCDIGIKDGIIAALATSLDCADELIDGQGLIAMPGGIDSHVHISQPSGPGIEMADDFASATRAAVPLPAAWSLAASSTSVASSVTLRAAASTPPARSLAV